MNEVQWEKFISESLSEAGKKIDPPCQVLVNIIAAAKNLPAQKYFSENQSSNKSHFSFNFVFNRAFYLSAAVALILLIVVFSLPAKPKLGDQLAKVSPAISPVSNDDSANLEIQDINNDQSPTTSDVDAAVTAILASVSDEDSTLTSDVDGESLSDADSAAVDNLTQNYDQDQF